MKQSILLIGSLILTTGGLVTSCKKGDDKITSANPSSTTPGGGIVNYHIALKGYDGGARDCIFRGTNCGKETIFTGTRKDDIMLVIAGGSATIGNYFSSEAGLDLAKEMSLTAEQTSKLASGKYNLLIVQSGSDDQLQYLLAGPEVTLSNDNVEFAIPFRVN